ncbi:MAG TPA: DUF6458 family protein [Micromonosporaceae bacterium]|jgi:Domain of unknown function (DUF6458)
MGIGSGIFLMAVGAILAYGVTVEPDWLDLDVVGWVLILAGATIVALTIWFWRQRRRHSVRPVVEDAWFVDRPGPVRPDRSDVEPRTPPIPTETPHVPPPNVPPRRDAPPR